MGVQTASEDSDPMKTIEIQARLYRADLDETDALRADLDAEIAATITAGIPADEIEAVLLLAGLDPDQLDLPPLATG